MTLLNKKKEATINLLTSLTGIAWRQIEHVSEKLCDDDDGFGKAIAMLDACFQYDERVEMPRALEKFFYQLQRRSDQTLLAYTSEHREQLREIEKYNIKLPSSVSGWLMLRRSGLSAEQRQMVQSQCGTSLEATKIEAAMFFLFGQDYRGRQHEGTSRWTGGKGQGYRWQKKHHAYTANDYDWDEADYDQFPEEIYAQDDENALEYDWEDNGVYFNEEDNVPWPEEDMEPTYNALDDNFEDDDYDEAFATYLDARRRFADLRAARGYWNVVAVPPSSSTPPPSSGSPPHGGPRPKGKGKGGKSKGGKGQRPFYQKGSASARAQSAPQCLKCGQSGHWSSECPSNSKPTSGSSSPTKKAKTTEGYVYMVEETFNIAEPYETEDIYVTAETYINQRAPQQVHGIMDNGASSVLVGHNTLMSLLQCLHLHHHDVTSLRFRQVHKMFHFGGDASSLSTWCVHLPVTVGDQSGRIQVFIVEGDTPLLHGRPLLAFFNIKVDYANDLMTVGDSDWFPAHRGARGEFLLQLTCSTLDGTDFDLMTDDVIQQANVDAETLDYDTVKLQQYIEQSNMPPPEFAYNQQDKQHTDTSTPTQHHLDHDEDPSTVYKPITNKLLKTITLHHNMEQRRQATAVEQAMRAHDRSTKQFWEVYSGSGHLSQAMQDLGYQVKTFDLHNGWDFTIHAHRKKFMKLLRQECPDFVWLAPPCTIWSPLQELTPRTPEEKQALLCEREYQEHIHLKFTRRVFDEQARDDRDAGVEQPARAKSWKTATFLQMQRRAYMAWLDQCAYGATLPDKDGVDKPIKKPTALCLTDRGLASDLSRTCPGGHDHLPIEGSSPGLGNRAKASATYQPYMCQELAHQIHYHTYLHRHSNHNNTDTAYPAQEAEHTQQTPPEAEQDIPPPPAPHPVTGILQDRLHPTNNLTAQRTIQRLHRNLGHPTPQQLHKLLSDRKANDRLLASCLGHRCQHCEQRRAPPQVPKSGLYKGTFFNDRVQADTLWLKIHSHGTTSSSKKPRAVPILVISDATTRFAAARLLPDETAKSFVQALERAWVRNFGTMKTLQVDEHRSWASDTLKDWTSQQSIQMMISPGQAHERLAIIERRHHVIRRALELFLMDSGDFSSEGIIQAINYVIPQVNRMPNVQGYSPLQWTLGYSPHVPGLLMEEELQMPQLHPTQAFRQKLTYQSLATQVIAKANNDDRLRRALLRQHVGNQAHVSTGDLCYYWRDAPQQGHAGPKILWRGPATVVMKEMHPHEVLWLAHGTSLIRAAPEHVRPLLESSSTTEPTAHIQQPLQRAQQALHGIRGRGVTQYIDLTKSNKRKREEVDTEDEEDDIDSPGQPSASPIDSDSWQVSTDGQRWVRIHRTPREKLYCPTAQDMAPIHMFTSQRVTELHTEGPNPNLVITDDWKTDNDKTLGYQWTGTTTFTIATMEPEPQEDSSAINNTPLPPPFVLQPPSLSPPTPEQQQQETTTTPPEPELPQLGIPATDTSEVPMDPAVDETYRPQPDEDFQAKRARLDRQETITYRQQTAQDTQQQYTAERQQHHTTTQRAAPYGSRPIDDQALYQDIEVDTKHHDDTSLPPGWHIDETGYIILDDIQDEWQLKGNYLIRRHYLPRQTTYTPTQDSSPIPLTYLTNKRTSKMTNNNYHDTWNKAADKHFTTTWTGTSEFKIQPAYRKLAQEHFYNASEGFSTYIEKKKTNPANLSERSMSLADRLLFLEAKRKELRSFFENDVWTMVNEERAEPQRVLKAHFILKWSTNADGSPRAKARLITQGFRDPDAWSGALRTNSPTLTRLSRGMILSICSCMGWCPFTSDISTAFLQGKAHSKERTLWIRLPRDARQLLGMKEDDNRVMQLHKPMYGLCDAPRAWYMEAVDRILSIPNVVRHPLDACLFMVYDNVQPDFTVAPPSNHVGRTASTWSPRRFVWHSRR